MHLDGSRFKDLERVKSRCGDCDVFNAIAYQKVAIRSHNEYDLRVRIKSNSITTRNMVEVKEIPLAQIRCPLPRANDQNKVTALMESIEKEGLHEPIDVLEVDGQYYGFSGCHRYEAHQRLGKETIKCRVRKAPRSVLQRHLA